MIKFYCSRVEAITVLIFDTPNHILIQKFVEECGILGTTQIIFR